MNMNFDDGKNSPREPSGNRPPTNYSPAGNDDGEPSRVQPTRMTDFSINPSDVLCGRGKLSFNHGGNKRFRDLVARAIDGYNHATSRLEKTTVVNEIVEKITAAGGRFLRRDEKTGTWHSLTHTQCREKCAHAIRDATASQEARIKRKTERESARTIGVKSILNRPPIPGLPMAEQWEEKTGNMNATQANYNTESFNWYPSNHHPVDEPIVWAVQEHIQPRGMVPLMAPDKTTIPLVNNDNLYPQMRQQMYVQQMHAPIPTFPSEMSPQMSSPQLPPTDIPVNDIWRMSAGGTSAMPVVAGKQIPSDDSDDSFLKFIEHCLGPLSPDTVRNDALAKAQAAADGIDSQGKVNDDALHEAAARVAANRARRDTSATIGRSRLGERLNSRWFSSVAVPSTEGNARKNSQNRQSEPCT